MTIGAKVSTGYRKLRLGVRVVDARAEVSYVLPVALIDYVALKVSASLDALGRNPFITDGFVVTDSVAIEALKNLFEQVSVSDEIQSIDVDKALFDSATVTESIHVFLTIVRNFADSVGTSDTQVIDFVKNLSDSVSTLDAKFLTVGKALSDSIGTSEKQVFGVDKVLTNSAHVLDAKFFAVYKLLTDAISTSDTQSLVVDKLLFEVINTSDAHVFDISKLLSDGVAMNDMAEIGDGLAFELEAYFTNMAFANDTLIRLDTFKGVFDTASVEDTGSLICQDYCDITYFAEDYVGQFRTFT